MMKLNDARTFAWDRPQRVIRSDDRCRFSVSLHVSQAVLKFVVPADPFADAPTHHVLEVLALQPRQFLGEEGDALPPGARHAGDIGAPEEALRPERVENSMQAVLDVAEGIALRRIMRRAGRLQ